MLTIKNESIYTQTCLCIMYISKIKKKLLSFRAYKLKQLTDIGISGHPVAIFSSWNNKAYQQIDVYRQTDKNTKGGGKQNKNTRQQNKRTAALNLLEMLDALPLMPYHTLLEIIFQFLVLLDAGCSMFSMSFP